MDWVNLFDERQQAEIKFSLLYVTQFSHGTDGHNAKVIIAKMANLLHGLSEDKSVREHIQRLVIQKKIENDEK